jgi:hypothetical protein
MPSHNWYELSQSEGAIAAQFMLFIILNKLIGELSAGKVVVLQKLC